jgi:hypothetical protein
VGGCDGCRRLLERERRTAEILGSLARVQPRSDGWTALEAALRPALAPARCCRLWSPLWRTTAWAGTAVATAALAAVMLAPSLVGPPVGSRHGSLADMVGPYSLAPATAAGISQERRADPLLAMQDRMDVLLDAVAEQPS